MFKSCLFYSQLLLIAIQADRKEFKQMLVSGASQEPEAGLSNRSWAEHCVHTFNVSENNFTKQRRSAVKNLPAF
jgi:hypothetical protein